jgi:hypothetical protein
MVLDPDADRLPFRGAATLVGSSPRRGTNVELGAGLVAAIPAEPSSGSSSA